MIDGGYFKNFDMKVVGGGIYVFKGGIVEFCCDIGWLMMVIVEMEWFQCQMFVCFVEVMLFEFECCYINFSWGCNNIIFEKMDFIGVVLVCYGFSILNF